MKNNYKLKLFTCWMLAILMASCSNDDLENSFRDTNQSTEHLANEAKVFFESAIGDYMKSHEKNNYSKSKLYPGDYTPKWDEVVIKKQDNTINITVPIIGSRNIKALCAVSAGKKARAYVTNINQFLVLEKCLNNGEYQAAYIQSVIADNSCYKKYGTKSHVKYINPHSQDFSGLVCNHNLAGSLISIKSIQNGEIVNKTDSKTPSKNNIFSTIGLLQIKNTPQINKTRFWGEDEDDEWWKEDENTDWSACISCGGGGCFLCSDWDNPWGASCSYCDDSGCLMCTDDDDYDFDGEDDVGFSWKCPHCAHSNFISANDQLSDYYKCNKCNRFVKVLWDHTGW